MARGWKIWTALGIVYIVWGSTYFAIKISVETMPPLLSAGLRFTVAGVLLGSILALRRTPLRVPWREARAALVIGVMLLACGVGVVTLAETRIDSSVAAMIAGSVPLQVILWRTLAREHVATATKVAAVVGIGGLALIIGPAGISGGSAAIGLAIMLCGSIAWSTGSFISRRMPLPKDPFVATVYEMIGGGLVLMVAALAARGRRRPLHGGDLGGLVRRMGLPRGLRVARRVHRLRMAAPPRADLAGRHPPVRQPGRRDRPRQRSSSASRTTSRPSSAR